MSNNRNWTVLQVLQHATDFLSQKQIENARLNAEQLLCKTLDTTRIGLYLDFERPLTAEELSSYKSFLTQRAERVPLQYLIGETEFMSLPFEVSPAVLIPRPETEILVEKAIEQCNEIHRKRPTVSILDIGTGSGCIAVSLAYNLSFAEILAIDSSRQAIEVAKSNARKNGVAEKIQFQYKNILQDDTFERTFDLIISNPPYVSTKAYQKLPVEIQVHEPAMALRDDADGLTFYRRFAEIVPGLLQPDGVLAVEVGDGQAADVQHQFDKASFANVTTYRDLNGIDRVVLCKL